MKIVLLAALLTLAACGGEEESKATAAKPFDEMTETLDKAKAVELELQKQKDRMDRAIDEAEAPPESRQQ